MSSMLNDIPDIEHSASRIGVIIPAYRAAGWLPRCIQSVLDQPGVDAEIVVVEDGVFDDTRAVVSRFPDVRFISSSVNGGAAYARNIGLHAAESDYLLFLDADDFIEGPLLAGLVDAMDADAADIGFGPMVRASDSGRDENILNPSRLDAIESAALKLSGDSRVGSGTCSVVWRRTALIAGGGVERSNPH